MPPMPQQDKAPNRRVFISHGNKTTIVEQLKDMLTFGKYEPVSQSNINHVEAGA